VLHLHRAERADRLVDGLAAVLGGAVGDPMEPEVIAVPTRGVERWLAQRLSMALGASPGRADGVCANIDFPFPGRLVGEAVGAAAGVERDRDPWAPERCVWPLLEVVDDNLGAPWLGALAAHLGGGDPADDAQRRARRFPTVRRLADLFDRYGVHRPAMLRTWAEGHDRDGAGAPLPEDLLWQARLWRRLRERLDVDSPAERLTDACRRLREEPALLDLPERVSLFGLTRLPASYLEVLRAIAAGRDLHLFALHPSPALWAAVAAEAPSPPVRRTADPTALLARNPLLASWGQDAREMQLILSAGGDGHIERHHGLVQDASSLLARVQAMVRGDVAPPGPPLPGAEDTRAVLANGDRSIQVHACHGRARQVEVLRDALLHLFADRDDLEPRDVIVMCPDIEAFAPLIHATFGAGSAEVDEAPRADGHPPDLRVRLADRSLRQTNPVLGVVAELLQLASARITASQVVDLASREPVRRRFELDDDDLARVEEWVASAGIRWGLDAPHRAPYKLDRLPDGTWRSGLDRILLGVAMSEDGLRLVGGVLPLDDVDSGDIDLAGRLAELVDRLAGVVQRFATPQPVADWAEAIADAADALTATSERDAWQRSQLQRLLAEVVDEASTGGVANGTALERAEVRTLLADRLRGRPTRASFRTGHLTMCTLVPMRSVPHRVVCLLGLDDGVFPRQTAPDGDDLLQRDARVGDRDARSEDRQLLLDALLAATEQLVVTYTGRDERSNAPRPPAVPVGELLDVVDRTARAPDGVPSARGKVVVEHPLQPFDARNFVRGALVPDRPWSFDTVARDGARAARGERAPAPGFLDAPLPPEGRDLIELDSLVRFAQHPVRAFLRLRLGVVLADDSDDPADELPVELDALQAWEVGRRLLEGRLAGADMPRCRAAEVARGGLPPGTLGARLLDGVAPVVDGILAEVERSAGLADPSSVEVHVDLGAGRALVGTVPGVSGDLLRTVTYSRIGARQRVAAWVHLLALTAAHPERPFTAVTVGRAPRGRRPAAVRVEPLAADPAGRRATATSELALLIDLFDRGMREPLPLYCRTSEAYAAATRAGRSAAAARLAWTSTHERANEDRELEHRLVLGGERTFEQLLDDEARADEQGERWCADEEATRFGRYARRMWDGLLARECAT
jgi:exodeoxyribonuclease V gamma subunit